MNYTFFIDKFDSALNILRIEPQVMPIILIPNEFKIINALCKAGF